MPIHVPGKRDKRNRARGSGRKVVAVLSLTAMVDMFTVLVVFLLQNYNMTGQVIDIPEGLVLPQASSVKQLKPSNVVILSKNNLMLNGETIADLEFIRETKDWLLPDLKVYIQKLIAQGEQEKLKEGKKATESVQTTGDIKQVEVDPFRKMTLEADESIEFLSVKKVMYTLTEAGIQEINFAVIKKEMPQEALNL